MLLASALFCLASAEELPRQAPAFGEIHGKISAKDFGYAVQGVKVGAGLLDTLVETNSDENGFYALKLPAGPQILTFQKMGFESLSRTVTVKQGSALKLDLMLESVDWEAEPVVVQGQRLGLSKQLREKLNAPLVPTPTAFEKKIAPAVKVGEKVFMLTIWTMIILATMGVTHSH